MVVFVEACNPRSYRQSNIDPVVRSVVVAQAAQELPPEPIPGIILALNESTPAGGCVNTSLTRPTAPMQDRCWPYDIALYNMPVVGKEVDLEGVRRLTNYVWTMRTTFMACLRQIDISCVQTYGPVGCYAWTISNVAPLPIAAMEVGGSSSTDDGSSSSSGSSGSSSSSSSSSTVGIIVGCVVGGVVAVLAVVGAVLLLAARRRRRRERDSSGGGRACRRHADPEKGCQLAAADADADAVAAGDDNGGTGCCGLPSNRSQRQQRQQQYGAAAAAGHCDSSNDSRPCAAVDQQSGSLHPPTGRGPALACSSASAAVTAEDHAAGRLSAAADDVTSTFTSA
ncbi:hypothetical protein HXX76_015232 [Chlamydomonas incerta]|uniref:Uncharacterized protein n=1 Tax=Chlamydomonas incerta TaxID=51695 RepID=A0A835VQ36_CHLIN|nr:hypothetical protein HXX76_015232 [Chlamydomonas incerta]|eukprot:KAG2423595.1 hypothetical protein HXX76_015232 [Chlamydomonas incerta]